MESERIKILDENKNPVGVATRAEVHRMGHWHETFHCWLIRIEDGLAYIYFQLRSGSKKDFPNLLDITAAGHILADENVYDGTREVKEELGIDVSFNELVSLGVIKDCIITEDLVDREFGHVFLYCSEHPMDDYKLQTEEVSGIVKAKFESFYQLWLGKEDEMRVEGFEITNAGEKVSINRNVSKAEFVPHENAYYESIVKLIRQFLANHNESTLAE